MAEISPESQDPTGPAATPAGGRGAAVSGALMHERAREKLKAAETHGMVASAQLCHLADGFSAPDDAAGFLD